MKLSMPAFVLFAAVAAQDPDAARDAKLIAAVKQVSIHKLDVTLPDLAFENWLQKQSGPQAKYHWEVNDCGEQTGSPDDTGPVPLCVEVDSTLNDGREVVIFVADDRPPQSKLPDWKIFFAQLTTPHERINLRHLSDLPDALVQTHRRRDHPEVAN